MSVTNGKVSPPTVSNRGGAALVEFTGRIKPDAVVELGSWVGARIEDFTAEEGRKPEHVVLDFSQAQERDANSVVNASILGWQEAAQLHVSSVRVVGSARVLEAARCLPVTPGLTFHLTQQDAFEAQAAL